jgi:hypothetical protein
MGSHPWSFRGRRARPDRRLTAYGGPANRRVALYWCSVAASYERNCSDVPTSVFDTDDLSRTPVRLDISWSSRPVIGDRPVAISTVAR